MSESPISITRPRNARAGSLRSVQLFGRKIAGVPRLLPSRHVECSLKPPRGRRCQVPCSGALCPKGSGHIGFRACVRHPGSKKRPRATGRRMGCRHRPRRCAMLVRRRLHKFTSNISPHHNTSHQDIRTSLPLRMHRLGSHMVRGVGLRRLDAISRLFKPTARRGRMERPEQ